MMNLKVVFVGTGSFGTPILEQLIKDPRIIVSSVVTGRDMKAGRGLQGQSSEIKKLAELNKLIIHQPERIAELKQKLIQEKPDVFLVVSYGEIIDKNILEIPRLGAVNIHPSLLPKYRGASPIQEAILHGDSKTALTWILMNKKMDSGNIISQKKIAVNDDENFMNLSKKLQDIAAKETSSVLFNFAEHKKSLPQDESQASYCKKIEKKDGFLNPHKESAEFMVRKIRAYNPWPGCYIFWNGKRLKIVQARVVEQKINSGDIVLNKAESVAIGTIKNALLPVRVQPEGKREMDITEFLRGQKKIPGKL